jgi:hypothetical protein
MEGFSSKQQKALAALIVEPSIAAAATKSGVGETTIFRWLKEPEFAKEYRRLRRDAVEQSLSQLQSATSEAVQTLRDHLSCEHPATAVRAAQIILDQAVKAVEIVDLQERLEQIENAIEKQDKQSGTKSKSRF